MNPARSDPAARSAVDADADAAALVGPAAAELVASAPDGGAGDAIASTPTSTHRDGPSSGDEPGDEADRDSRSVWRHLCADGCNCRPI